MSHPTEAEIIAAIQGTADIFAQRQGITPEKPSAEIARKFDVGNVLAVSLMVDLCGQWSAHAAYNGVEFYADREPDGQTHCAFEDDCWPLMPMILVALRDVVMGTAVLGIAQPASVDSILSQTQIALAAIGPRLDIDDLPVTHPIAVVYERLKAAAQALLATTAQALHCYWQVKQHDAHSRAVKEVMTAIEAWDACLAVTC